MATLDELIDRDDPALPLLEQWVAATSTSADVLPVERGAAEATLLALQVTTRSTLGALAFHTGGVLVDGGWLRVLGGGSPRLPRDLAGWNQLGAPRVRLPGALLVGDDALGGFFAVDGGAFGGPPGRVWYLSPDTVEWESLDLGHADWVYWALTGDLRGFYQSMRWPGWAEELAGLAPDQGLSIVPFLWAEGPPLAERSRRAVPLEELWALHALELPRQLHAGGGAQA